MTCWCDKLEQYKCNDCTTSANWNDIPKEDQIRLITFAKLLSSPATKMKYWDVFSELDDYLFDKGLCVSMVPECEKFWKNN